MLPIQLSFICRAIQELNVMQFSSRVLLFPSISQLFHHPHHHSH